jgi:hypothetical protein
VLGGDTLIDGSVVGLSGWIRGKQTPKEGKQNKKSTQHKTDGTTAMAQ